MQQKSSELKIIIIIKENYQYHFNIIIIIKKQIVILNISEYFQDLCFNRQTLANQEAW